MMVFIAVERPKAKVESIEHQNVLRSQVGAIRIVIVAGPLLTRKERQQSANTIVEEESTINIHERKDT
jgi:hypothetical protein